MPSMHNVAAMTIALLGWKINRKAGIAGSLFAFAIFLGSIHLGWHYAVDAYFGFLIAGICWWVSGHVARWYMQLSFVKKTFAKPGQAGLVSWGYLTVFVSETKNVLTD